MKPPARRPAVANIAWHASPSLSSDWLSALVDARDALLEDEYEVYVLHSDDATQANLAVVAFPASANDTNHVSGLVATAVARPAGSSHPVLAIVACGPSEPPVAASEVERHAPTGHNCRTARLEQPSDLLLFLRGWVAVNARVLAAVPSNLSKLPTAPPTIIAGEEDACEIDRRAF